FGLTPRSLQLDQVVITGTGGVVQKRAVGNVVETLKASDVLEVVPARTVDQLVGARTPGVIVLPASGQVGTGAQLRIRGASSLSLSNDPIVYIDGVSCQIGGFNLYQHDIATGHKPVFQTGRNQGYITSLSGGTDANRYYLSGSYDDDVGVVSWNWDRKFNGRANVDVQANDKLRLQGSVGYIRDRARLAQLGTINVDPFSQLIWGTPLTANTPKRGFSNSPPEEWPTIENHADNDRTTVSLT